ncbi:MAG: hypothetical protein J5497_08095, partial [Selenomonadaceae bacterium]|nr:hypothetical protein [Selenomonadaceae bacterium]
VRLKRSLHARHLLTESFHNNNADYRRAIFLCQAINSGGVEKSLCGVRDFRRLGGGHHSR